MSAMALTEKRGAPKGNEAPALARSQSLGAGWSGLSTWGSWRAA